jgi:hypothetical protein
MFKKRLCEINIQVEKFSLLVTTFVVWGMRKIFFSSLRELGEKFLLTPRGITKLGRELIFFYLEGIRKGIFVNSSGELKIQCGNFGTYQR